ncbi:TIGR00730 family Rossman fold protein [Pseudonocardia sp. C8]|uniref:LOG family protein n=1 Tax=Pseudonocardia sp. C8 TaxID=2762759 RepID=UPI001642B9CF|nr:TIGR00730 family Rossman fold protein [Pseudonocardia sp. C8]MBC3190186.1 TIGR00730 family Rossman fold protein [Pseudonocardia sp. C8]
MAGPGPGFAVCVYCASSDGVAPHYVKLADAVGRAVAARGWTLVSGGGRRSMMGAVAAGARAAGGRTVGVIPRSMVEREWADHDSDELVITESMRERKQEMEDRADAFLALPGGLGTCEELFEVWSAGVLGLHGKPVVLLDPDGHWDGLLDWVAGLGGRGFATFEPMGRLRVVRSDADPVGAALDACARPVG